MGCAASVPQQELNFDNDPLFAKYTLQAAVADVVQVAASLDRPQLQAGRVIKLIGAGGFFNESLLLQEGMLEGLATNAEYVELIRGLNRAAAGAMVGYQRSFDPKTIMQRRQACFNATKAYIARVAPIWAAKHGIALTLDIGPQLHGSVRHVSFWNKKTEYRMRRSQAEKTNAMTIQLMQKNTLFLVLQADKRPRPEPGPSPALESRCQPAASPESGLSAPVASAPPVDAAPPSYDSVANGSADTQ
jgi:hypothetical protein